MAWNAASPDGTISVKANRAQMNANITYIQTTMGNSIVGTNTVTTRDHFWNVGANEDGRHRFVQSPAFTVGAVATDPVIGTGMDGVQYLKTINTRAEWFHRNSAGIYQITPGYKTGTKTVSVINNDYTTIDSVPANVWGEIYMWRTTQGKNTVQQGFFRSDAATVEAFSLSMQVQGSNSDIINIKFGNGSEASGLNIRARNGAATNNVVWNYRITYRAI